MSFEDFYRSDLQGVYALLVVPALFLLWRLAARRPGGGADPSAASFVSTYCVVFALETIIDPLATRPLASALGGGAAATALGLLFVLLGDFRVYLLLFHLASTGRDLAASTRRALVFTPIVAVSAFAISWALGALLGELPPYVLYLSHELLFVGMMWLLWRRVLAPARRHHPEPVVRFLGAVAGYVAFYYALWASADVLILLGVDAGYALRVVPNQLYYAFYVPFVWWAFFGRDVSGE